LDYFENDRKHKQIVVEIVKILNCMNIKVLVCSWLEMPLLELLLQLLATNTMRVGLDRITRTTTTILNLLSIKMG